ncbi:hypothetical protein RSAG8_06740, partial [Rhizoctonia solani AG-8 WAC10335]
MTEPPKNKSTGVKPSALRFLTQNPIQNKDPEGNDEIATHGNRGQIYTNFQIPSDFGRRRKLEPWQQKNGLLGISHSGHIQVLHACGH